MRNKKMPATAISPPGVHGPEVSCTQVTTRPLLSLPALLSFRPSPLLTRPWPGPPEHAPRLDPLPLLCPPLGPLCRLPAKQL